IRSHRIPSGLPYFSLGLICSVPPECSYTRTAVPGPPWQVGSPFWAGLLPVGSEWPVRLGGANPSLLLGEGPAGVYELEQFSCHEGTTPFSAPCFPLLGESAGRTNFTS